MRRGFHYGFGGTIMKIAVPHENGSVFEHFGHATEFKIYTVEDIKPIESEIVHPEDVSHEAVAGYLKKLGVDLVLCDGIGDGAREAIEAEYMLLCSNVSGDADEAVQSFLDGTLDFMTGSSCAHHAEESSCGGCCGSCGGCHGAPREPYVETRSFTEIVTLTAENFQQEVMDDPSLIAIDFWAEWCQPCKLFAPTFEELNREEDKIKFCRVNVDEQPELAAMFGIDSIPTLAVVQDRHTLTGMVGVHDKKDVREMLDSCR